MVESVKFQGAYCISAAYCISTAYWWYMIRISTLISPRHRPLVHTLNVQKERKQFPGFNSESDPDTPAKDFAPGPLFLWVTVYLSHIFFTTGGFATDTPSSFLIHIRSLLISKNFRGNKLKYFFCTLNKFWMLKKSFLNCDLKN